MMVLHDSFLLPSISWIFNLLLRASNCESQTWMQLGRTKVAFIQREIPKCWIELWVDYPWKLFRCVLLSIDLGSTRSMYVCADACSKWQYLSRDMPAVILNKYGSVQAVLSEGKAILGMSNKFKVGNAWYSVLFVCVASAVVVFYF